MFKDLMETVESRIALLASANLSLSGVAKILQSLEPVLNVLVTVGQIAVAVVTVIYIVQKTILLRRDAPKRRKTRK